MLVNIEQVTGSAHDDMFYASAGTDLIDGGKDSAPASQDDNAYRYKQGDTVSYEFSEKGVTVELGAIDLNRPQSDTNNPEGSYARGDILVNIENVIGSEYADTLQYTGSDVAANPTKHNTFEGRGGDDVLKGGDWKDYLTGGAGADVLTGGAGDDVFVFSPEDGRDVDIITDFRGTISGGVGTDYLEVIDLTAFDIELDLSAFKDNHISELGGNVVIDLTGFGGGTILLENRVIGDIDLEGADANILL